MWNQCNNTFVQVSPRDEGVSDKLCGVEIGEYMRNWRSPALLSLSVSCSRTFRRPQWFGKAHGEEHDDLEERPG